MKFIPAFFCLFFYSAHVLAAPTISVMTWNTQNLFDTVHDEGKLDFTYLPLSEKNTREHRAVCETMRTPFYVKECLTMDWNESVLNRKMNDLADVILNVNNGLGPDVLILEEVENLRVLEQLRTGPLKTGNYRHAFLLEAEDERGIDTAIISRLPMAAPAKLHLLRIANSNGSSLKTRGILEATLTLPDGRLLTVFAAHFPSQNKPSSAREAALLELNRLKKSLPADRIVMAAGDFNIITEEDAREKFLERIVAREWLISHKIGCTGAHGTFLHRGSWSFLDMILFSTEMASEGSASWKVRPGSIKVLTPSCGTHRGFAAPTNFFRASDHLPIVAELYSI
jgi:endonuclease/exonuclease/phosphatase family metal-dependent hydrolase